MQVYFQSVITFALYLWWRKNEWAVYIHNKGVDEWSKENSLKPDQHFRHGFL